MNVIRRLYHSIAYMGLCVLMVGCNEETQQFEEYEVALGWANMALHVTQYTPANSPTYASRCLGYLGLTMYESVVHGYPDYQSVATQLNGLGKLPEPEKDEVYHWVLSMNAAVAFLMDSIYNQTSDVNKSKMDSLENSYYESFSSRVGDSKVIKRSVQYGKSVAQAIYQWSKLDGGHRGYLSNFDKNAIHPDRPGSWKPPLYAQSFSHHPLHPYWGENRTFLEKNGVIPIPDMIPYDTIPGSPYYEQFMEVYQKDLALTQKEKEIAIWWGDDPDETFTPPGHSFYLATVAIKKTQPSLIKCTETYAKVGMAVADAFIKCWNWKYHYFSERPNTYIPQFIDEEWESFWPDPPFPAFPSGHAIQAAASATVLTDLYGVPFAFIDSAHVGRKRDELRDVDFVERPFNTFWEVAEETADSRFYGGIHTPQDNQVGLEKGAEIARNVTELKWKKERPDA